MQPRQCAGCGAPLPHTDTAGVVTCRFCGMAHDADRRQQAAGFVVRVPPGASRSAVRVLGLVAALIGLAVGVVGLAIGVAAWRIGRRPPANFAPASYSRPAATATAADLPTLPARRLPLSAAAPSGGYAAVDAVQVLPWALSLAQQWAPDAAVERIDVQRMRPDGTVNAADDPQAMVRYRFVSPERIAQLRLRGRTTSEAAAVVELHLGISGGAPYVQGVERRASSPQREARAPHPDVTALGSLLPRLGQRDAYRAPFLNGYLTHLDGEGWVWYFGTLDGESLPRVRATDGQPWPYQRSAPARRAPRR